MTDKKTTTASTKKKDLSDVHSEMSFEKFYAGIGNSADPVMAILRAHLFTENVLERLICVGMKRGDKALDNGSFTYNHKLAIVEGLGLVPDTVISVLRNLNKVRNQC